MISPRMELNRISKGGCSPDGSEMWFAIRVKDDGKDFTFSGKPELMNNIIRFFHQLKLLGARAHQKAQSIAQGGAMPVPMTVIDKTVPLDPFNPEWRAFRAHLRD